MTKTLYAVDENGAAIPGAVYTFSTAAGPLAILPTGANGTLILDTDGDDDLFLDGVHVVVSADGYENAGTDTNIIPAGWKFTMVKGPNYIKPLLLGIGLASAAFILTPGKKKSVAGINMNKVKQGVKEVLPYAIPAGLLIGGYILVTKLFSSLGVTETAEDKARDAAIQAGIDAAGAPTMTDAEIQAAAGAIFEDLGYSWVANNTSGAVAQLCKPQNTADILGITKAYGRQILKTFGIPRGSFTLEETVSSQLSQSDIDFINTYYDAQGINFKF